MNVHWMLQAEKAYHCERLEEAKRCRLARQARNGQTMFPGGLALWLGERLINLGWALKKSALRRQTGHSY